MIFNPTPLARPVFALKARKRLAWADPAGAEATQRRVLARLMRRAAATEVGRRYNFASLPSYEAFAEAVPVVEYEQIRADVERMVAGDANVLWPGRTMRFAQSSGTSGGKSKYIPVTADSLNINHYPGATEAVVSYLNLYPKSRLFAGKSFILGGSFANEVKNLPEGVLVGDVSASLIDKINPAINLFRIPSKSTALMPDWREKLPKLVEASYNQDVTNISGVPSWFLTVIRKVLERTGESNIHRVWPNLEVFFHGGVAFGPYREQYAAITDPGKMRYIENYNASEGFFAVQDSLDGASDGMRLLLDVGVFFEFQPLDGGKPVPAWEVEKGRTYALLITAPNGLWRYSIGDTVRIESTEPLRISIAGRTNAYINVFGEELMVWNADAALARACERTGATVADYTAAPVYTDGGKKGHHQWFVEWSKRPACSDAEFAAILDAELQAVNSDYEAKRTADIFLAPLDLVTVPTGTFEKWLAATGKLGGQRKVPRLCNDRRVADAILKFMSL